MKFRKNKFLTDLTKKNLNTFEFIFLNFCDTPITVGNTIFQNLVSVIICKNRINEKSFWKKVIDRDAHTVRPLFRFLLCFVCFLPYRPVTLRASTTAAAGLWPGAREFYRRYHFYRPSVAL